MYAFEYTLICPFNVKVLRVTKKLFIKKILNFKVSKLPYVLILGVYTKNLCFGLTYCFLAFLLTCGDFNTEKILYFKGNQKKFIVGKNSLNFDKKIK